MCPPKAIKNSTSHLRWEDFTAIALVSIGGGNNFLVAIVSDLALAFIGDQINQI